MPVLGNPVIATQLVLFDDLPAPTDLPAGTDLQTVLETMNGLLGTGSSESSWKTSVRCATTGSITISTGLNSGDTIDGVTLADGDRVLVKDQGTGSQNGIYIAGASPARSTDFTTGDQARGAVVFVEEGTANKDTFWMLLTNAPITIGSTTLVFSRTLYMRNNDTLPAVQLTDGIEKIAGDGATTNDQVTIVLKADASQIEMFVKSGGVFTADVLMTDAGAIEMYATDYILLQPDNDLQMFPSGDITMGPSGNVDMSTTSKGMIVPIHTSDPTPTTDGMLYYNSSTDKLRLRANGAWVDLN